MGGNRVWQHSWEHARRWAFASVPALALFELAAVALQAHSAPRDRDWLAARAYVVSHVQPEDLVTFAPRWVDPIGRELFGPAVATVEREARPDESRFPRAFEVSIRGEHTASLADWPVAAREQFGRVTVTTRTNPAPAHVLDDLVSMVSADRLRVSQVRGGAEAPCPFVRGAGVQSGGLGFGPAIPGERFACASGAFAGVSVVADLDYFPRRCIYAPPTGSAVLRLRFRDVRFGRTLHGHHALYVEAERSRVGAPVNLAFSAGDTALGTMVHRDGDGWKPFEIETPDLAGKTADLVVDINSSGERRMYCFEADTR